MFGNVDHVILFVSDMKRATNFYREVLGFEVASESPHFTRIQTGNIWIGLHPTESAGRDIGHGGLVYFTCKNMDEALAHFRKHQVKTGYSQAVPNGKIQTFYDSEGNALGLFAKA